MSDVGRGQPCRAWAREDGDKHTSVRSLHRVIDNVNLSVARPVDGESILCDSGLQLRLILLRGAEAGFKAFQAGSECIDVYRNFLSVYFPLATRLRFTLRYVLEVPHTSINLALAGRSEMLT